MITMQTILFSIVKFSIAIGAITVYSSDDGFLSEKLLLILNERIILLLFF